MLSLKHKYNLYFPITFNKEWLVASVSTFNIVHDSRGNVNASTNQFGSRW